MNIRKKLLIGLLLAALSLTTVAGISFAASTDDSSTAASGFVNGCRGFFGGVADELAKLLGLTPAEIVEKRNSGESLADIAKEQGVSKDEVVSTMLGEREELLNERVKAGIITEEQKDYMLERMRSRLSDRVDDPSVGPGSYGGWGGCGGCGGPGGYGGPGARGGFGPGYRNAPTAAPTSGI